MEITYPILEDGQRVGDARIERMGMFLCIRCKCLPQRAERYKVIACCDGITLELGICRPDQGEFALERRIPAKGIFEERLHIQIVPEYQENFLPLHRDKPFSELRFLSSARFFVKDGQPGLII